MNGSLLTPNEYQYCTYVYTYIYMFTRTMHVANRDMEAVHRAYAHPQRMSQLEYHRQTDRQTDRQTSSNSVNHIHILLRQTDRHSILP